MGGEKKERDPKGYLKRSLVERDLGEFLGWGEERRDKEIQGEGEI